MPIRGIGVQTVTGTPQPAFATTLTAAIRVTPDPHTGMTDPRSQQSTVNAPVVASNIFRVGDKIMLGPAGGPYDWGKIYNIPDATHVLIQGLSTPLHASGEWLILAVDCARVKIRANASQLYIGEDNTVGVASLTLFDYLLPGESYDTASAGGNVYGTSHYWLLGTAADTFIANLTTI